MIDPAARTRLRSLAMLYLEMAHGMDDFLSPAEMDSLTEKLLAHVPGAGFVGVQDVILEALDAYTHAPEVDTLLDASAAALDHELTLAQKRRVLDDLGHVAGADGVVLHDERGMLHRLAERWGIVLHPDGAAPAADGAPWGVHHDLAYIYLQLAHATDNELSPQEMQVMRRKLHEWLPQYSEEEMGRVLDEAMARYARGFDEAALGLAITSVRHLLPHEQRMAALNDLIKIANADGVFLDIEEDMINQLLAAWNVDPHANYGSHGSKG